MDPIAFEDAYIYKDVLIQDVIFGDNGVYLKVFLTPILKQQKKGINWNSTKRMNFGSLVILTDEKLEKMFFATVYEKPKGDQMNKDYQKYGNVEISIKGLGDTDYDDFVDKINDFAKAKLIIVEARTYFEGYHHFLKQIQSIKPENMPFEDLIVKGKQEVVGLPIYVFNLEFKKTATLNQMNKFNILQPKWPKSLQGTLNDSQYSALRNILTSNCSLIQGPPGTGKT